MADAKPKYLLNPVNGLVLKATPILLKRNDLYGCDAKGKLLSNGEYSLPDPTPSVEGEAQDKEKIELDGLREEARTLKIPGFNNAKKETLIKKIAEAREKAKKNPEPREGSQSEGNQSEGNQ